MNIALIVGLVVFLFFVFGFVMDAGCRTDAEGICAAVCALGIVGLVAWVLIAWIWTDNGSAITFEKAYKIQNVHRPDGSMEQVVVEDDGTIYNANKFLARSFKEGQLIKKTIKETKPSGGITWLTGSTTYEPVDAENDKSTSSH